MLALSKRSAAVALNWAIYSTEYSAVSFALSLAQYFLFDRRLINSPF